MRYFKNVETLEELRRQYKELLKQFHPDNPQGSTEATQSINAEYDKLFKVLKNITIKSNILFIYLDNAKKILYNYLW